MSRRGNCWDSFDYSEVFYDRTGRPGHLGGSSCEAVGRASSCGSAVSSRS